MTKLKLSSKMHLLIIISVILFAVGMAIGTIFHFTGSGFFNYGDEFSSYKNITVDYVYLGAEQNEDTVKSVCEDALDGLSYVEVSYYEDTSAGRIVYKFDEWTSASDLQKAVDKINASFEVSDKSGFSVAEMHENVTFYGGARVAVYATIAVASAIAFHLIYVAIRYKLNAALSALVADLHNLGVFVALVALTRIPVGIDVVAFAVATVAVTLISSTLLLNRVHINAKNEDYKKTPVCELVDTSAGETVKVNAAIFCALGASVVVAAIFAAIAAISIAAITPYVVALLAVVSCAYGALFFTPAVHSRLHTLIKFKTGTPKYTPAKKTAPAAEEEQA